MCCLFPLWPLIPTIWLVERTISNRLENMRTTRAELDMGPWWPGVVRPGQALPYAYNVPLIPYTISSSWFS